MWKKYKCSMWSEKINKEDPTMILYRGRILFIY
jgi:hypothetical protein